MPAMCADVSTHKQAAVGFGFLEVLGKVGYVFCSTLRASGCCFGDHLRCAGDGGWHVDPPENLAEYENGLWSVDFRVTRESRKPKNAFDVLHRSSQTLFGLSRSLCFCRSSSGMLWEKRRIISSQNKNKKCYSCDCKNWSPIE